MMNAYYLRPIITWVANHTLCWIYRKREINLPDKATISLVVKFWLEKEDMRPLRFNVGAGMLLFAALKLAVVESLLPKTKFQLGPPS